MGDENQPPGQVENPSAPVSDTPPQSAPALPGAHAIFDPETFFPAFDARLAGLTDTRNRRNQAVRLITKARTEAMADIETGFATHPRAARETVRAIATLTDAVITALHHVATRHLHPDPPDTESPPFAIIAVGGYGRGEMAPHSDVDLLFLTEGDPDPRSRQVIEAMLYMLWDMGLHLGHAVRTLAECITLAEEDFTIRTSLLEHRPVTGDAILAEELHQRLRHELFNQSIPEFIEAKLDERTQRHIRQGGQRYMLEPNIKEGKGGLRDLQTLYWIAKYIHDVQRAVELVDLGVFTREEHLAFWQAEDFLWAIRCHLHLATGRPVEKLTFDLQPEIAARMGYHDHAGRRAVEHFMQDYFRHATRVGEITRVFLTDLEARHLRKAPVIERLLSRAAQLSPGFVTRNGRLAIGDEDSFLQDPLNLLRLFDEALRTELLIHPAVMRLVDANLHLIDDRMRHDPDAAALFLGLLTRHDQPERALLRMNELGVLAAFIPEFEAITAMMQFNHYHHYTVDEHLIQCIAALARIKRGEAEDEVPITTRILAAGHIDQEILSMAVLLHDIGKGRPEDHSILGARLARRICTRLGMAPEAVETVVWLVRNHLLMSDVAQKRDIGDPRTLRDFASEVGTRERLDLLTVLTVCDIRGVGPGVWNNWKAMLLRQLHTETLRILDEGLPESDRTEREEQGDTARAALGRTLATQGWDKPAIRAELARHDDDYWTGLQPEAHAVLAHLIADLPEGGMRIDLHPAPDHDATRLACVMGWQPAVFARMAGALTMIGANVVDARAHTSRDGLALLVFWVQDSRGRPYPPDHLPRLRATLENPATPPRQTAPRPVADRSHVFSFPTRVSFDNHGSDRHTIIEVDTGDRPGLLYDLTRTLTDADIQIVSARIATFGAQVVDSFYVKDMEGEKLTDSERLIQLESALQHAIHRGRSDYLDAY